MVRGCPDQLGGYGEGCFRRYRGWRVLDVDERCVMMGVIVLGDEGA